MHPAALPGRADEALGDGGLEAAVGIGDHEPDTAKAPGAKGPEELGPEVLVFGVADGAAEHLTLTGHGDAGDHYHGGRDDLAPDAALEQRRIGEDLGELDMAQQPGPERGHLLVEAGADAAHFAPGDPAGDPERGNQVINLAGGDPVT